LILSQTAEYALRAVLYIAQQAGEGPVRVAETSRALSLPQNYLSKTLHTLARVGVLASSRGPAGGFRLARPAGRISLAEIVSAFDRLDGRSRCLLGRPECSDANACAAHAHWKKTAEQLRRFFRTTSIADLMSAGPRRGRATSRTRSA
jgi:Rrf2 family protein